VHAQCLDLIPAEQTQEGVFSSVQADQLVAVLTEIREWAAAWRTPPHRAEDWTTRRLAVTKAVLSGHDKRKKG
jgi:hypothetical protein